MRQELWPFFLPMTAPSRPKTAPNSSKAKGEKQDYADPYGKLERVVIQSVFVAQLVRAFDSCDHLNMKGVSIHTLRRLPLAQKAQCGQFGVLKPSLQAAPLAQLVVRQTVRDYLALHIWRSTVQSCQGAFHLLPPSERFIFCPHQAKLRRVRRLVSHFLAALRKCSQADQKE